MRRPVRAGPGGRLVPAGRHRAHGCRMLRHDAVGPFTIGSASRLTGRMAGRGRSARPSGCTARRSLHRPVQRLDGARPDPPSARRSHDLVDGTRRPSGRASRHRRAPVDVTVDGFRRRSSLTPVTLAGTEVRRPPAPRTSRLQPGDYPGTRIYARARATDGTSGSSMWTAIASWSCAMDYAGHVAPSTRLSSRRSWTRSRSNPDRTDVQTLDWPPQRGGQSLHVLRGPRAASRPSATPSTAPPTARSTPRSCSASRGSPAAARCSTT